MTCHFHVIFISTAFLIQTDGVDGGVRVGMKLPVRSQALGQNH
jgi:hypothetical protein